jgi:hypothetical protein
MTILDEFHRDEQYVLDRLVDGELGPSQRRELLAALDDEPGAWRRCALAFLESQTWRLQLSRLAAEPLVAPVNASAKSANARLKRRPFLGLCLAVAASLLLAFGLGTRFPATGQPQDGPPVEQYVEAPTERGIEAAGALKGSTDLASQAPDAADESPWETLTLAAEDGADPESNIQLRVLNANGNDQLWAAGAQSAVSGRLVRELEEAGWEVKRERRLVPVELSDGRRMIVPVEEVDIRYPEIAQF